MKLILFEDTDSQATLLGSEIERHLGVGGTFIRFAPDANGAAGMFEDRLKSALEQEPYKNADLIIADRDLSKTEGFTGLAEPTVRRVAERLAIPECSYARSMAEDEYLRAAEQHESSIAVSIVQGMDQCASQVVAIARGFEAIRTTLRNIPLRNSAPGKLLAQILGKPEYAEKISLYASGDQSRFSGIFQMRGDNDAKIASLSCLLGYWLWDSILRFPGVVVNRVAAASYLNIQESLFTENSDLELLFANARYLGPFAEAKEALWWRGMLDDIVASEECADGREFAAKHLGRDLARSVCCEDPQRPAGYYCMISRKPVSIAKSKGNLPWFPRGADLARVAITQYEQLGPWL